MFSKYDVYTTVQSMYCYPDSDVLKNKLNTVTCSASKTAEPISAIPATPQSARRWA